MPTLRLGEADRVRLGAPEKILMSVFSITNREAIALTQMGFRSPRAWRQALEPQTVYSDKEACPTCAGAKVVGEVECPACYGTGRLKVDTVLDFKAWTALVWIALRRVGVDTQVETLEFNIDQLSIDSDGAPATDDPGKGDPIPAADATTP